jgi:hypothetical protein
MLYFFFKPFLYYVRELGFVFSLLSVHTVQYILVYFSGSGSIKLMRLRLHNNKQSGSPGNCPWSYDMVVSPVLVHHERVAFVFVSAHQCRVTIVEITEKLHCHHTRFRSLNTVSNMEKVLIKRRCCMKTGQLSR